MVSNFREIHQQGSPHIPHSANRSYFIEQVPIAGYMGPELGWTEHQHFRCDLLQIPHPCSVSLPPFYNMREAIQREIEKEQIREEIIMSEIMRRRVLEAEVRRELMLERELPLRSCNMFPFGATSAMEFHPPVRLPLVETRVEGRSLEGRIMPSFTERESLNWWLENGRLEPLPFQRGSGNLRISGVKPVPEAGKEKEKIVLLARPNENISGLKRKAETSPCGVDASEGSPDGNSRKKAKEEWSCAICQVSVTSELGLNEHLNGKKHKATLGAKKAGKRCNIGFISNKSAKSIQGPGTVDPSTDNEVKVTSEYLPSNKTGEASSKTDDRPLLQENLNSDKLSKKEPVEDKKVQKNDDPKKKKFRFWCEICQLGAFSEKVLNDHKGGKKHARMLQQSSENGEAGMASQKDKNAIVVNDVLKLDEHKPVDETKAGNGVAVDVTNPGDEFIKPRVADEPKDEDELTVS